MNAARMETTQLRIIEEDVIKIILEFLSTKQYNVTMRTLEKESCVINSDYSDEVLFLRELVLDGDFDEVMEFGNTFSTNQAFNQKTFNYIVLRQKFVELIYMKSHIIDKQSSSTVEEVMKTLAQLKTCCPCEEEYTNLCWLLTVPNLNTQKEFENWNLDISRLRCFDELLDCLSIFMPLVKRKVNITKVAGKDRLLHLIVQGLFYESCIQYCQSVATGSIKNNLIFKNDLLNGLSEDYSSNLLSWIQCLPYEAFSTSFEQTEVDLCFSRIKKNAYVTTQSFDAQGYFKLFKSASQATCNTEYRGL